MNHQPFEKLILQDEPLVGQDQIQLREHLMECDNCRELSLAWKAVDRQFQQPVMIAPTEGFADRWKARLDFDKKRSYKRQGIIFLVLSLGTALFLSLGILLVSVPLLQSPSLLFWTYIDQLLSLVKTVDIIHDIGISFYLSVGMKLGGSSAWISYLPLVLVLTAGVAVEILVLWFVILRKMTSARESVQ